MHHNENTKIELITLVKQSRVVLANPANIQHTLPARVKELVEPHVLLVHLFVYFARVNFWFYFSFPLGVRVGSGL